MRRLLLFLALAGLVFAGCSSGSDVGMTSSQAYQPGERTVEVGDTVVFRNNSSEAHTVTAYEDSIPAGADYLASGGASSEDAARSDLSGGLIPPGDAYEWTFSEPGTYRYFCIPHEGVGMKGTIVVEG